MPTAEVVGPTVEQSLRMATRVLADAGSATPRLDADLLLAEALDCPRVSLYNNNRRRLEPGEQKRFEAYLQRRAAGENVAYIRGWKEFYSFEFAVTPAVLIPRPETELLVDLALHFLRGRREPRPRVLDLCTGSGCLAITLARMFPPAEIVASDLSPEALAVAVQNAEWHEAADRIHFVEADGLRGLRGLTDAGQAPRFDVIVANPPYVAAEKIEDQPGGMHHFEPRLALDGGPDGLDFYHRVLPDLPEFLAEDSTALFEIGWDQGAAVERLMREVLPSAAVYVHQDGAGRDRVVQAVQPAGLVAQ